MKLNELQTSAEVQELERQLDRLFMPLGLDVKFTRHFMERLLGRERTVTIEEVVGAFDKLKRKYKQRLLKAKRMGVWEAVLKDFSYELNIVFSIKGPELVSITVKRKDPNEFVPNVRGGEELRV